MEKIIFGFFVFAFAGIGMEIIFTSLKQAAHALLLKKRLTGPCLDIRRFGWFLSTVQPFFYSRLFMTAP
ncbi:MAG: hypothetical protein AAB410_03010 [Patescibacteria group bacterium]|mgnify:CR=1 FL=1